MSDAYDQAFEDVLRMERERKPVFVLGVPDRGYGPGVNGPRVCLAIVLSKNGRETTVQCGKHVWCVETECVYISHEEATRKLAKWLKKYWLYA